MQCYHSASVHRNRVCVYVCVRVCVCMCVCVLCEHGASEFMRLTVQKQSPCKKLF